MKTVSLAYLQLSESGERPDYMVILQGKPVQGVFTEYEITHRIVDITPVHEQVENESLKQTGGDVELLLDNSDGFFLGLHLGGGIWDSSSTGDWRIKLITTYKELEEEPVQFVGMLDIAFAERVDDSFRVKVLAMSYSTWGNQVSAWDGNEAERFLYNVDMVDIINRMNTRLNIFEDLETDVILPTLTNDGKHYQVFDSLIEHEQTRVFGPRHIIYAGTSGITETFWVNGVNDVVFLISWAGKSIQAAQLLNYNIDNITRNDFFEADDLGTDSGKRVWVHIGGLFAKNFILVDLKNVSGGEIVVEAKVSDPGDNGTTVVNPANGTLNVCSNVSSSPANPLLGVRAVATGEANSITVGGVETEIIKYVTAVNTSTPTIPPAGYTLVTPDHMNFSEEILAVTISEDGDILFLAYESGVLIYKISTDESHVVPFASGSYEANKSWYLFRYIRAGEYWGVVTWVKDTLAIPGDQTIPAPPAPLKIPFKTNIVIVNGNQTVSNLKAYSLKNVTVNTGFTPADDVGLLLAEHNLNTLNDDEKIETAIGTSMDRSVGTGKFTQHWFHKSHGLGHRSYSLVDDTVNNVPRVIEDSIGVLNSKSLDILTLLGANDLSLGDVNILGSRTDGLTSNFDNPHFTMMASQGPTARPVQDARRVKVLVSHDITSPIVHKIELEGKKVRDITELVAEAAFSHISFRWDDVSDVPKFTVRPRDYPTDELTEDYLTIDGKGVESWDHLYHGVRVVAGLGSVFLAGDQTSDKILVINNDAMSPSYAQSFTDRVFIYFNTPRKVFNISVDGKLHWELQDRTGVYLLNVRGLFKMKIMSRDFNIVTGFGRFRGITHV